MYICIYLGGGGQRLAHRVPHLHLYLQNRAWGKFFAERTQTCWRRAPSQSSAWNRFSKRSEVRASLSFFIFSLLFTISSNITDLLRSLRSLSIRMYESSSFFRFFRVCIFSVRRRKPMYGLTLLPAAPSFASVLTEQLKRCEFYGIDYLKISCSLHCSIFHLVEYAFSSDLLVWGNADFPVVCSANNHTQPGSDRRPPDLLFL